MPDFTPHQESAIDWKRLDACVVAGPGSGKTTVLVERFRRLVDEHDFAPGQILAITFTEKAAANMKAKLAAKFRYHPVKLRELESAWVSTIHGFCARLLHENAIAAGIDPRFTVLDAREAEDLQFECIRAALDELVATRRADAITLIETLQKPDIAGDLRNAWDGIRSAGKTVEDVRQMGSPLPEVSPQELAVRLFDIVRAWPSKLTAAQETRRAEILAWLPQLAAADIGRLADLRDLIKRHPIKLPSIPAAFKEGMEELRGEFEILKSRAVDAETAPYRKIAFDVLSRFEAVYTERKRVAGVLDFNDLERRAIELLRADPEVRDRIRRHFRQVMLDEFQDINEQQSELIRLVRGDDVFFAVGDINQAIYGFRHARPGIFLAYQEEIAANGKHSARLMDNFRSRAAILRCVGALLNPMQGIQPRELIAGLEFPPKEEPSIEILRIFDDAALDDAKEEDCTLEARWIAHRILQLDREFRDYAVLCRNGDSMRPILEAFDAARIPYVCGRRQSFLVSREGLDIRAILGILANPRDTIALATVLRSSLVGLSDEALLRLRLDDHSLSHGLDAATRHPGKRLGFAPDDWERLDRFTRNLNRWRADEAVVPLDVLISRILCDCGNSWVPGSLEGDNIEAFLHLARIKGPGRRLLDFLRELESMEGAVSAESDLSDEDQGNCVQVMTAHAAKGLEFKVAIIAAMDKGTRRSSAPVTFTPEEGLGIKWKDATNDRGAKDSWAEANSTRLKQREEEESNRLLYVAMTRAEDHLILSYSVGRQRPSNWARLLDDHFDLTKQPPSRYPFTLHREGFDVAVLATDTDPPLLAARDAAMRHDREIPAVPRPRVVERHDTSVSATSLTVFASCPRKYYLDRYLGWSVTKSSSRFETEEEFDDDEDISASELGSAVHEILAGKPGSYPGEAHELAEVFNRGALGQRAAMAANAGREWDFIADLDETLVRGSVDLWFEENDRIFVVDYKTDSVAAPEIARRSAEYGPQLAIYALAIEKAFGKRPAAAYLHFLRPDVVREVRLDDAALEHARELIRGLREAQNALRFDLNAGDHCKQCQFHKTMCPAE